MTSPYFVSVEDVRKIVAENGLAWMSHTRADPYGERGR